MEMGRVRTAATSFIVRVWDDDTGSPGLRGEIEHIRSGERRFFDSDATLLEQIARWRPAAQPVR